MDELLIDDNGPVREFVLNRPTKHNALDRALLHGLRDELARAQSDDVRAIVLSGGESRSFCAGADLGDLVGMGAETAWEYNHLGVTTMGEFEASRVPVIAAVHGHALGGGLELALASTFIVASTDARFGLPEATLGLMPGYGGTQRLASAIGPGPATRFMMTGERFSAEDASRLGLLSEPPVSRDQLVARARELAWLIAGASKLSVELIATAVATLRPHPRDLDLEMSLAAIAISSNEAQVRMRQFLAKGRGK